MQMMKHVVLALAASLLAGGALAAVSVSYTDPAQFTDMPRSERDQVRVLKDISEHFDDLGKKLAPGQDVDIVITNIDLAGRVDMMRRMGGDDIRIMTGGADWPHMTLTYKLTEHGKQVAGGDAQLSDMMYLQRVNRYSTGDTLRYEKLMLDDWFNQTFGTKRK
jgi:hypothetical protein